MMDKYLKNLILQAHNPLYDSTRARYESELRIWEILQG